MPDHFERGLARNTGGVKVADVFVCDTSVSVEVKH